MKPSALSTRITVVSVAALIILGGVFALPASAHVSTATHLWKKHIKPLTLQLFYTKKQANARYYTKKQANARYYTKTQSNARYFTKGLSDKRYFFKVSGDAMAISGDINSSANPLHWTKLKGVPEGIADADGSLTADAFGFSEVQKGTLTIPGQAFLPALSSTAVVRETHGAYMTTAGLRVLQAPFSLPDGVTIDQVSFVYQDNSGFNASSALVRTQFSSIASATIEFTPNTSGASGAPQTVTKDSSTVFSPTKDSRDSWYLQASWDGTAGSTLKIYQARIDYSYQKVDH